MIKLYDFTIHGIPVLPEPKSYKEDFKILEWKCAMELELQALLQTVTWVFVILPKGKSVIGCKWVFRVKLKIDRILDKYKSFLVAKGFLTKRLYLYL